MCEESVGSTDRISEMPELRPGDKISTTHRGKNTTDRTLTVEVAKENGDYVLSGYGTQYVLTLEPQMHKPDWVLLCWQSRPEGRIVRTLEVLERSVKPGSDGGQADE